MPSPYSKDLRQRVMAHYERHGSATLTSQVFNISRSIIYDWKKLKQDTGDIQAKTGYQHGHSHKITDLAAFKARIGDSTGLTLKQMIQQSGIAMSQMTCSRTLKRLGMTRKKILRIQRTQ
jgi:transposase